MYEPLTVYELLLIVGVVIFAIGGLIPPDQKVFLRGAREIIITTLMGCGTVLIAIGLAHLASLAIY
jgi:hypothetical protein